MSGLSDIGFRSCISFISLLFINRMWCDRKREKKENNGAVRMFWNDKTVSNF